MIRPHVRNPRGFKDVFPVLFSYVVAVALLVELSVFGVGRPVIAVGTIVLLGWLVWAVNRVLHTEAIDPEEEFEYRRD